MIEVFSVVAPVFALIAIGYVCARLGLINAWAEQTITKVVFGIAIPTLLFRTMVNVGAPEASPWALWGAYFGGVALSWAVSLTLARWLINKSFVEAVMAALSSGYSNTVLIGIPLVFSFFGEERSAIPLFIILSINLPVMMLAGTLSIELSQSAGKSSGRALVTQVLRRIVLNPILIGLGAGLVYRQTGLGIAGLVQWAIDLIAWIAAPAALFIMGVSLNRFGVSGQLRMSGVILATKLFVHPMAVAVLALWLFELPPVWAGVAILFAAAPTGINVFLLASRYDIAVPAVSSAITLGTALSVVTITLISWALGFQSL